MLDEELRDEVMELCSAKVDVANDMDIFIATPVEKQKTKTKLRLHRNAAFFERSQGGGYKLKALVLLNPKHKIKFLSIILNLLLKLYFKGDWSIAKQGGRTDLAITEEEMKITGIRCARNGGLGHYKKGHTVRSVEALGCLVASLVGVFLIRPFLAGALLLQIVGALDVGGNFWASMWPYTLTCLTHNYMNDPHTDSGDLGMSFIAWLQYCTRKLTECGIARRGGDFHMGEYGVYFEPQGGSILYFDATSVSHYTDKVDGDYKEGGRFGIALAVSLFCYLNN